MACDPLAPHHWFGFCFARCHLLEDSETWLADSWAAKNHWNFQKGLRLQSPPITQALQEKRGDGGRSPVSDSRFAAADADKERTIPMVKPTDGMPEAETYFTIAWNSLEGRVAVFDSYYPSPVCSLCARSRKPGIGGWLRNRFATLTGPSPCR
jgi:hypothetical protein